MRDPTDMPPVEDPLDGEPDADDEERQKGFVPEFVRRIALASLGAVFMSEAGIRRLASQLKLPKEALGFLLQQADHAKSEVGRVVSEELRKVFQSDRLRDEFLKLLANMTIEVRAEVKLVPDKVKGEAPSLLPKVTVNDLRSTVEPRKKGPKGEE